MPNLSFLYRVIMHRLGGQDQHCPHCRATDTTLVSRKKWVLHLRRCQACRLMYRWPKDPAPFNRRFYQRAYRQTGLTTDLPDASSLQALIGSNFAGTEKDFSPKIGLLRAFVPAGAVLDFGCSWGYATYQLRQAGFEARGFEISEPRAEFGRTQLNVPILSDLEALSAQEPGTLDAVFTSHVLEHLPTLDGVFERFHRLLRTGGHLVVFVPNCDGVQARRLGVDWGPMINEKHTMAFDRAFFETVLPRLGFEVAIASDLAEATRLGPALFEAGNRLEATGDELVVVARKVGP